MSIKISILGAAGTLGSCTAFRLATQGLADELVMIDVNQNRLRSHLWDIQTAVSGLHSLEIREGVMEDLAGSDIVINNAGAPWRVVASRMEKLQENIPLIKHVAKQVTRYCPQAVVITSTNPVDPLNLAMHRFSGLDREKLLGYTLNDSTRFQYLAAEALGVSATRVQGTVIGEHGDHAVLVFSSLTVDGRPASVDDAMRDWIQAEHSNILKKSIALGTGWTSGWTSSIGLAAMVSAVIGISDGPIPCSVMVKGEYGADGISMGVPARLGMDGVTDIVELNMTRDEKAALEKSTAYLHEVARDMSANLNGKGGS